MAEHVRALDSTRLVTNGVNAALAVLDELPASLASRRRTQRDDGRPGRRDEPASSSATNVTRRTAESSSVLDVLGLNYADGRYAQDRELFPHRVIVGSETFPSQIGTLWPLVAGPPERHRRLHLDRLGLPRRGGHRRHRLRRGPGRRAPALEREFPYLTALVRRPRHHRLAASGLLLPRDRLRPAHRALHRRPAPRAPRPHDLHAVAVGVERLGQLLDLAGLRGQPVTVEVYADADEVALLLDGVEVARGSVGDAQADARGAGDRLPPGDLVAVAYRAGAEVGRTSPSPRLAGDLSVVASADRTDLRADDTDLAFVAIELRDAHGIGWSPAPTAGSPSRFRAPACWPACAPPTRRRPNASTPRHGRPSTAVRSPSSARPAADASTSPSPAKDPNQPWCSSTSASERCESGPPALNPSSWSPRLPGAQGRRGAGACSIASALPVGTGQEPESGVEGSRPEVTRQEQPRVSGRRRPCTRRGRPGAG